MSVSRRLRLAELLEEGRIGKHVVATGWVRTARHGKERSFVELSDGSTVRGLQVVAEHDTFADLETLRRLRAGCAVEVEGKLVASPGRGQALELRAEALRVLGEVDDEYPLQKKRHSYEFLRTIGHLRLRTQTLGAVMRIRHAAARAIRDFLDRHGFIELHTPIITTSDCEGAGELFRVTALDLDHPPRAADGRVDWRLDFFERPANLTVSGQLEAEIGALALRRVYSFGPAFRAENSHTSRHLAEFWMVEPEIAFCELDEDIGWAEALLRSSIGALLESCSEELELLERRIEAGLIDRLRHLTDRPWARLRYEEALRILRESGERFEYPVAWGLDLQSEHERYLTERHVRGPVVIVDYPKAIKPFYMYVNDDGETVRAMDVLMPRIGEIVGGSQREHRPELLERRIAECGLRRDDYGWYLELRRFGSVPHAGFGLGFERFLLLVTGMSNIREVIPFPRAPGWAEF